VSAKIPYVRDEQIQESTCEQMRDFFEWMCQLGRGRWEVRLSPHGLEFVAEYHDDELVGNINIVPPPEWENHNKALGIVYVAARF